MHRMNDTIIIATIHLTSDHTPTGKTKHYRGEAELPVPSELRIVQYADDTGYYLLYYDSEGNEITDTYHEDIKAAVEQAKWEYSVKPEEWDYN